MSCQTASRSTLRPCPTRPISNCTLLDHTDPAHLPAVVLCLQEQEKQEKLQFLQQGKLQKAKEQLYPRLTQNVSRLKKILSGETWEGTTSFHEGWRCGARESASCVCWGVCFEGMDTARDVTSCGLQEVQGCRTEPLLGRGGVIMGGCLLPRPGSSPVDG
jgi:hypothetical protein